LILNDTALHLQLLLLLLAHTSSPPPPFDTRRRKGENSTDLAGSRAPDARDRVVVQASYWALIPMGFRSNHDLVVVIYSSGRWQMEMVWFRGGASMSMFSVEGDTMLGGEE
jgi:hypothetical protein